MYNDIRPYTDSEVTAAVERIAASPYFPPVINYLFPSTDIDRLINEFRGYNTVQEVQVGFMRGAVQEIVNKTIAELVYSGFSTLNCSAQRVYLSNHRDIVMDSALLQFLLTTHGINTTEITFGSNLMTSQFVVDLGKLNKMFKFMRSGDSPREVLEISRQNASYIRHAITQKKQSVWIAQRNGRTKDGNDRTDVGVLKMFAMGSDADFVQNLAELNITPVSVSYEYEPCDFFKVREIYISRRGKYVKQPDEDMNSVLHGITQWKGGVSIAVCDACTEEELEGYSSLSKNDRYRQLAAQIDERIYRNYKLWSNNYIAYDMLHGTDKYSHLYTAEQRSSFCQYAQRGLNAIDGDQNELTQIFYGIYANPVLNSERCCISSV